ncbi:MAG: DUF2961 domain-containing protein [Candidatus Hydrogenedentota bacterium]|nr:MAG: DUF2961 domain-containing protein [Candidatus Hydrogenedentota bacterium]
MRTMELYRKPRGLVSRWAGFENLRALPNRGGLENFGAKGHPSEPIRPREKKHLLEVRGSGLITRIWLTLSDRSPEILRSLKIEMTWDDSSLPAVSVPLGDFFGIGLGRTTPFESALFSNPEGRSFNCFIPMPFRNSASVTLTNDSDFFVDSLFYDIDFLLGISHPSDVCYFHAQWRRESPNQLGRDFVILPPVQGAGRFLGCNIGIITNPVYENAWWGEGEVKIWLDNEKNPTLCGSGTEDYIGTAWGMNTYSHQTQGCLIADAENRQWSFYRYHISDPVYFDRACRVSIQTIGGTWLPDAIRLHKKKAPLIPVTICGPAGAIQQIFSPQSPFELENVSSPEEGQWCNFFRQDDWSATAYFYLDSPICPHYTLPPLQLRVAGLSAPSEQNHQQRVDG